LRLRLRLRIILCFSNFHFPFTFILWTILADYPSILECKFSKFSLEFSHHDKLIDDGNCLAFVRMASPFDGMWPSSSFEIAGSNVKRWILVSDWVRQFTFFPDCILRLHATTESSELTVRNWSSLFHAWIFLYRTMYVFVRGWTSRVLFDAIINMMISLLTLICEKAEFLIHIMFSYHIFLASVISLLPWSFVLPICNQVWDIVFEHDLVISIQFSLGWQSFGFSPMAIPTKGLPLTDLSNAGNAHPLVSTNDSSLHIARYFRIALISLIWLTFL
jgi:hypothetical protein